MSGGISRLADSMDRSGLGWGLGTLGLGVLSLLIPLPYTRLLIAAGLAAGLMFALGARNRTVW